MPVTDNIDDLVNDILNTVDYVEKDIPRELVELATQLQLQLQKGGSGGIKNEPFKNRTGNLRRSMSVTAGGEQLKVSMLWRSLLPCPLHAGWATASLSSPLPFRVRSLQPP